MNREQNINPINEVLGLKDGIDEYVQIETDEILTDPNFRLLYEIARNTKTTSLWIKFLGIVVLIGIIWTIGSAIVLSLKM